MRYKLRTLLILLAMLPPLLAVSWWGFGKWQQEQQRRLENAWGGVHIIEVDPNHDHGGSGPAIEPLSHYGGGATQAEPPDLGPATLNRP